MKFYQLEGKVDVQGNEFQLVKWPDNRRGGVIEMGAVLAMTSHYEQTSPVLRGAWVLETLLGTPVPPPPPNVPPLDPDDKLKQTERARRSWNSIAPNPACAACHKLMDPIGFALENFDWMGRWRDKETNGKPLDTSGELPSGEKFNGPVELRQALLNRKDDFLRHLTGKVLGYALGRGLQDGDSCTVQHLVDDLAKDGIVPHADPRNRTERAVPQYPRWRCGERYKQASASQTRKAYGYQVGKTGPRMHTNKSFTHMRT